MISRASKKALLVIAAGIVCVIVVATLSFPKRISREVYGGAVGSIGGVSLCVPSEYLYFPPDYVGEDIWSGKRLLLPPTLEAPISTMSFLARLPDMQGKTPENAKERMDAVFKFSRTWIDFQIEDHRGSQKPDLPWAKMVVGRIKEPNSYFDTVGWHYEKTGTRFGLTEENLVGADEDSRKRAWISDKNLMYDQEAWTAYIQCETYQMKPRHRQRCRHSFSLRPRINAHVTVHYDAEHLKDWRKIQEDLAALLYGFVYTDAPSRQQVATNPASPRCAPKSAL